VCNKRVTAAVILIRLTGCLMKRFSKYFLLFWLSFLSLQLKAQSGTYINHKLPLSDIITSRGLSADSLSILIDKSDYKLTVLIGDQIIKEYPVVFGGNPIDDKLRQGDGCTPEGDFHMISKYPHKSWSKFIWIDYPTSDSWRKHNKAKKEGRIPGNADIGGQIGIHGVPKGTELMISQRYNWTLGCISMTNRDVNELYPYIQKHTLIRIQ